MGHHHVLYNKSGDVLHAASVEYKHVIGDSICSVPCKTENEALFLAAILNADVMLPAFKASRQSDRHFTTHFWRVVPIPRYDKETALHRELAELAKRAKKIAKSTYAPEYGEHKMRTDIRKALHNDGVSGCIDDVCRRLFPNHT